MARPREISPRAAVAWRRAASPQGARGGASVVREHRPEATLPRARRSGRGRGRARGTAHFFEPALSAALAASELGARSRSPILPCTGLRFARRSRGDERKAVTDLFVIIVHFPPFSDCFLVKEHISLTFRERKTSVSNQTTSPQPLKLKRLVGGDDFADSQAKYRRCNRCAKKGAKVRCTRCRRAYYCSRACLKAAWKLEICECC